MQVDSEHLSSIHGVNNHRIATVATMFVASLTHTSSTDGTSRTPRHVFASCSRHTAQSCAPSFHSSI
jgi:hypothetical protein